jgi:hypothetical protein
MTMTVVVGCVSNFRGGGALMDSVGCGGRMKPPPPKGLKKPCPPKNGKEKNECAGARCAD